ncbi:unnamed protein product [Timema podura]|uniref:Uncharacterized protein n=1 Tax=Timema podura TaxID=61482 RepID=A0ABN7PLB6_TIMPD|nr:unnamed protein product [Timema podura]
MTSFVSLLVDHHIVKQGQAELYCFFLDCTNFKVPTVMILYRLGASNMIHSHFALNEDLDQRISQWLEWDKVTMVQGVTLTIHWTTDDGQIGVRILSGSTEGGLS